MPKEKLKIHLITKKDKYGLYTVIPEETFEKFFLYGVGKTKKKAVKELLDVYKEIQHFLGKEDAPDLDIEFKD